MRYELKNTANFNKWFRGLKDAANIGTTSDLIHALNIAARAKGMTEVARQAGVSKASLYKTLADNANPKFETINKIIEALGCKLAAV